MVERNERLGLSLDDGKKVPSPPEVVAFAFNKPSWGFPRLSPKLRLMIANPTQP
jgi:hypothetical protein